MSNLMKNNKILMGLILVLFISQGLIFAQGKKYAAVEGDYEFDMEGQIMVISFWEEEGKLWGAPEGETPAEISPMEGETLKFDVDVDGQYYEVEFVKDESGKVNKCILRTMGMELEGVRIKK